MSARDPHADEALASAFAELARARPPSRFETARAGRELADALDLAEARSKRRGRRALRPALLAGALAGSVAFVAGLWMAGGIALGGVALGSGGAGGSVTSRGQASVDVVTAQAAERSVAAVGPAAPRAAPPTAVSAVSAAPPAVQDEPPSAAEARALQVAETPEAAPRPIGRLRRTDASWSAAADALAAAGDDVGAARLLASALRTDDAAAGALVATLRHSSASLDELDEVDAMLAEMSRAEPMRVRCELRLLYRRDRGALETCRAFAMQWPEHPGARVLSFAAGRVAEDELGDLEAAEAEYSRALLLSPLSGLSSTDALLARARVRAARGVLDEARADLRLYLHQEPAARADLAVQALMIRLGVGN